MGGKRIAGHRRTAIPLSAIDSPRQRPSAGWRIDCTCGWTDGPFVCRADGEKSYSTHLIDAYPKCAGCGEAVPRYRVSRLNSSLCRTCSYAKVKAWKEANPKQWERLARSAHLKKQYGITIDDYNRMLSQQNNCCAVCGRADLSDSRGFRPHVDHCHRTGRVRGILCGPCNKGLGQLQDDPEILRRAIAYLEG